MCGGRSSGELGGYKLSHRLRSPIRRTQPMGQLVSDDTAMGRERNAAMGLLTLINGRDEKRRYRFLVLLDRQIQIVAKISRGSPSSGFLWTMLRQVVRRGTGVILVQQESRGPSSWS